MYKEPNYQECSVEELQQVLETIDKAAFPERVQQVEKELSSRIRQKAKLATQAEAQVENTKLAGLSCSVYSPNQAMFGTLLGGPFASIYFIQANFKAIGELKNQRKTLVLAAFCLVILFVLINYVPDGMSAVGINVAIVMATKFIVEKLQFTKDDVLLAKGVEFEPNWLVLLISAAFAVGLFAISQLLTVISQLLA